MSQSFFKSAPKSYDNTEDYLCLNWVNTDKSRFLCPQCSGMSTNNAVKVVHYVFARSKHFNWKPLRISQEYADSLAVFLANDIVSDGDSITFQDDALKLTFKNQIVVEDALPSTVDTVVWSLIGSTLEHPAATTIAIRVTPNWCGIGFIRVHSGSSMSTIDIQAKEKGYSQEFFSQFS